MLAVRVADAQNAVSYLLDYVLGCGWSTGREGRGESARLIQSEQGYDVDGFFTSVSKI